LHGDVNASRAKTSSGLMARLPIGWLSSDYIGNFYPIVRLRAAVKDLLKIKHDSCGGPLQKPRQPSYRRARKQNIPPTVTVHFSLPKQLCQRCCIFA